MKFKIKDLLKGIFSAKRSLLKLMIDPILLMSCGVMYTRNVLFVLRGQGGTWDTCKFVVN